MVHPLIGRHVFRRRDCLTSLETHHLKRLGGLGRQGLPCRRTGSMTDRFRQYTLDSGCFLTAKMVQVLGREVGSPQKGEQSFPVLCQAGRDRALEYMAAVNRYLSAKKFAAASLPRGSGATGKVTKVWGLHVDLDRGRGQLVSTLAVFMGERPQHLVVWCRGKDLSR